MVDLDSEGIAQLSNVNMFTKRKELLSTAMKRTSEWIFSQEIPSDVTVQAGRSFFQLHKFPLVSKCGYIRKLLTESNNADHLTIEIPDIPGGGEAFELVAKFCYGVHFELSTENIAMLRCASEYLEMTEEYAIGNLVGRTESYLNEVTLKNLAGAISILHSSENFLPIAEKIRLVSRSIDVIAYIACKDSELCTSDRAQVDAQKHIVDWWAEDFIVLRIDFFQRVLVAMMSRGFKHYALAPILMLYAQKSLQGLEIFGKERKKIEPRQEHEKRVVLETIVSLLPREKDVLSVSFLSMLLRASIHLESTDACRFDLEKRVAMQLGQAVLDDLLIPSYSFTGDTLFDVETVQRIMVNFQDYEMERNRIGFSNEECLSPTLSDMERVGRLMDNYLAEIASDLNLSVSKFISLAEVLPEQSRITEDGMYRAIDIYLKAHPTLNDSERKNICSVMDCQKLSQEACAHAAQNERLPVQIVVQVLYYEQQRLREVMNDSLVGTEPLALPSTDEVSSLKRENRDLKSELVKMRMKLKEIENAADKSSTSSSVWEIALPSVDKFPHLPRKSFISSLSKKFKKLYPFIRPDGVTTSNSKASRSRRHSIS